MVVIDVVDLQSMDEVEVVVSVELFDDVHDDVDEEARD